ncbi:MAG TPA: 30S ribosomal protein S5 [Candidatus Saccharimonadales bacterium]|nr:30S ribosomal protein S5 [Candidatus Saccharimonadales bacterium]
MAVAKSEERRNRRPEIVPEEKQFDDRTLHIDRVARVVKGGRRFRFRALVVVGDRKHRVGIGSAKGADVTAAVTKATEVAKKNFIKVSLYKGTLPHEIEYRVGGAHILLKPASPGTGLIAGGVVRTILEVAGVSNALSKSLGSSNKTNTAYATIGALNGLVPSNLWVTPIGKPKLPKASSAKFTSKSDVPKSDESTPKKTTTKKLAKVKAKK